MIASAFARAKPDFCSVREASIFSCGQDKGDEHGLAASVGVFIGGGGQTGQAVAAVDQLFDCEEQDLILRHGR